MKACRYCGRVMGDKAVRRHEKVCEKNPNPDSMDLSVPEAMDQEEGLTKEEQEPAPTEILLPPSFPAAMCPDTLVLKENNQMFFKVTGRRIGDVVYIEGVRMLL